MKTIIKNTAIVVMTIAILVSMIAVPSVIYRKHRDKLYHCHTLLRGSVMYTMDCWKPNCDIDIEELI